jgi:hypothetical protein
MREIRSYGSVRGGRRKTHPYRAEALSRCEVAPDKPTSQPLLGEANGARTTLLRAIFKPST